MIGKSLRILIIASVVIGLGLSSPVSFGAEIDELKAKISEKNTAIAELEKEIEQYQKQINEVGDKAKTLENHIKTLTLSINKLNRDVAVTENQIEAAGYTIKELALEIAKQEDSINQNIEVIAKILREIDQNENQSLVESALIHETFSEIWNDIEVSNQLKNGIRGHVAELSATKADLEVKKRSQESERDKLNSLKNNLANQKQVVSENKVAQSSLLSATKNKEAEYQKQLKEKLAKKAEFEQELFRFESELQIAIDPSRLPAVGKGVLRWPLDKITITQYFGNTAFASQNPQVYNGKGHTGIDFRATIGTPIMASASGIISGVGDTDLVKGCYSYGRWVLINHNDGLSTLYAHLSLISVTIGQEVKTGEVIGYSGSTGYATGPHLHFGVYATQGIRVVKYANSVNCKNAVIPIADPKAYLNPLSYL